MRQFQSYDQPALYFFIFFSPWAIPALHSPPSAGWCVFVNSYSFCYSATTKPFLWAYHGREACVRLTQIRVPGPARTRASPGLSCVSLWGEPPASCNCWLCMHPENSTSPVAGWHLRAQTKNKPPHTSIKSFESFESFESVVLVPKSLSAQYSTCTQIAPVSVFGVSAYVSQIEYLVTTKIS